MTYSNKTSLLVASQLPEFVRDNPDYANFVLFLQAYYEWMEQQGGVVYGSQNLMNYDDIDNTMDEFIQYYVNDFIPLIPEGSKTDTRTLVKVAKQLYQSKGTPDSFKFLFRALYNSETQTYNTKDFVLRPSDGKWVQTRYLNVNSTDYNWTKTIGRRLFGETSKGFATIENIIPLAESTQVVLSGIERQFSSGEIVVVVDDHGNEVYINDNPISGKVIGVVSSVTTDPANSGAGYVSGDPVIFYGGLNPETPNPVGATAVVGAVSGSQITSVTPTFAGHGYRAGSFTSVDIETNTGSGGVVQAQVFDTEHPYTISLVPKDAIESKANVVIGDAMHLNSYNFANLTTANATTKLQEALTFPQLTTYGILATQVLSPGAGYDASTVAKATAYYSTDATLNTPVDRLYKLGILSPIEIQNGGINYALNDTIVFTGGRGYGAYANVTGVDSGTGSITSITYVKNPAQSVANYPLGGMGYDEDFLPSLSVHTSTGSGASLYVPGIVGHDAKLKIKGTDYGQVKSIVLLSPGKDYIAQPKVSLRVQDMLVTNVNVLNQPRQGDKLYQGTLNNPTFVSYVDSFGIYQANSSNSYSSTYNARTYEYTGSLNTVGPIYISRNNADMGATMYLSNTTTGIYTNGLKTYGNGAAKASANFYNGIVLGNGYYVNHDGQPSGYSVLEDNVYNDYTYRLQVEVELSKFKDTALKLLHPSGLNYYPVNMKKSSASFKNGFETATWNDYALSYLIGGVTGYQANVASGFSKTINFTGLSGANLANVIAANDYIKVIPNQGETFYSKVTDVTENTVTVEDYWVTSVPNVAIATANSGTNVINIDSITDAWKLATGNVVSRFSDFIYPHDHVSFNGTNTDLVIHVGQPDSGDTTLQVNTTYGSAQSGYLSLRSNVVSSNVFVTRLAPVVDVLELTIEDGRALITENNRNIIL
jgi:hypothetical protein